DEAKQYARSRSAALQNTRKSSPNLEGVFGLARCMAENRAFIARQGNREKGTVFVVYEQVLPDYVREAPLHAGHLRSMLAATENGAIIVPPVPAFYHRPKTIDDIVNQTIGRCMDLFDIDIGLVKRWPSDKAWWPGRFGIFVSRSMARARSRTNALRSRMNSASTLIWFCCARLPARCMASP